MPRNRQGDLRGPHRALAPDRRGRPSGHLFEAEDESQGWLELHAAILVAIDELSDQQFPDQPFVDARLLGEVEALDRLERRECRGLDSALGRPLLSLDQFPLAQLQQEGLEGLVLLPADGRHGGVFPQDRRQLELLEAVFQ